MILLFVWFLFVFSAAGGVRINEVADKGSTNVCNGKDWVELYVPPSEESVNLTGYMLHDDKGPADEDAYTFSTTVLKSGEYLILCMKEDGYPQFGIGSDDTVTLLAPDETVISTTGQLSSDGVLVDVTYAWDENKLEYGYTSTPTPGSENIVSFVQSLTNTLEAQNALGTQFFNMDTQGYAVAGGFEDVVDLRIEMDPEEFSKMMEDQSYEMYSPFISASITSYENPDTVLLNLTSPGRIRPRGQSTLAISTCLNYTSIPFKIDFSSSDGTQTLYGSDSIYLRNSFGDASFMRDWSAHRMLARFNLPHLRTRTARFYVNDEFMGVYDVMEAMDQPYIFHRSFPDYDSTNYALYKAKTMTLTCGEFNDDMLARAQSRLNETSTPPYAFERGDHREKISVLGSFQENPDNLMKCFQEFVENLFVNEIDDAVLAYVRAGNDCGKMLVEEGLMDRDLGSEEWDDDMEEFINTHLSGFRCNEGCQNSNLSETVDIDNFLKNFAVYAVLVNQDSPMGIGNNYYLAQSGDFKGWKMAQYDHNGIAMDARLCNEMCTENIVNWSIVRPTCGALEDNRIVGPLLSDPELHQTYIEHVRDFTMSVVTNSSFLEQVQNHALILEQVVPETPSYVTYAYETSLNGSYWDAEVFPGFKTHPFLPFLVARGDEVVQQLSALDNGTFPRGPHLPVKVELHEQCVNWRSEADESPCYKNCQYDECQLGGNSFFEDAYCNAKTGDCYHRISDQKCAGVADLGQYDDMQKFTGSDEQPFCFMGMAKSAKCPVAKETTIPETVSNEALSAGCRMKVAITWTIPILSLFLL